MLRDLEACQITQIPRRPHARQDSAASQDQAGLGIAQRLQALVSAFHYGGPVAFGWIREHPGGPVRVLAAGPTLRGDTDTGQAVLTFPPGARAEPLPPGQAAALLARMPCWLPLAGITDALLAGGPGPPAGEVRPSLEDGLLSVWSDPFAWLLLAEPLTSGQVGELADQLALAQLGVQRSDSPRSQLTAQRLSARHAELLQAAATGLWQVRFVAGGPAPPAAAQVAGLLCASADLEGLPYALTPVAGCAGLQEILGDYSVAGQPLPVMADSGSRLPAARPVARQWPPDAAGPLPQARARADPDISAPASPFYASSRLVAALARSGYTALVAGAFCEAAERRFGTDFQLADVITFVGDVRARSERLARELDPDVAERVIRAALGDGSVRDLSDAALGGAQLVLLAGLIADEQLDDAGLDAFLVDARKLADQLMS